MSASIPHPAATVILVRDGVRDSLGQNGEGELSSAGFEIFMVKRHSGSGFMADAHVFPGGRVDDSDRHEAALACCSGLEVLQQTLPELPQLEALGFYLGAIRELFEEAGALLARDRSGQWVSIEAEADRVRFGAYRSAVHQAMLPLPLIAAQEALTLPLDALAYWSHWVTPEIERRRFDTRFFVARVPPGQSPLHDAQETTQSAWMSPSSILEHYRARRLHLAPPTLRTLEELEPFESVDALLEGARARTKPRIQPHFVQDGEQLNILLPGDPEYPDASAPGVQGPTRIVMEEGRWWSRTPARNP